MHNGKIPRKRWILPLEREAVITYAKRNMSKYSSYVRDGYRRLTYMMIDEGVACVSPSTTYRVLKSAGLLNKWDTAKKSFKGRGYKQPLAPHQEWHTDIKYVNFKGTYLFFIGIIDGYTRYMVHHELRTNMTEYDVEITLQRALEKYPLARPRLITDNGAQYISKDFQHYLKEVGLQHLRISVGYPQSNGKVERFHRSLESECLKQKSLISLEDARNQVDKYIEYYNKKRLHSALFYLTPEDFLDGRESTKLNERQKKLDKTVQLRMKYWDNKKVA